MLHAGPSGYMRAGDESRNQAEARRRYAEVFFDVEKLVEQQSMTLFSNKSPF